MSVNEAQMAPVHDLGVAGRIEDDIRTRPCGACTSEIVVSEVVLLGCDDVYCGTCLAQVFRTAMTDETMYPPRCCGIRISLRKARPYIPKDLVKLFRAKELELATKNKTYCWKPRCSTFIAPHSIHNGEGYCQKCRAITCSVCKSKAHFGKCTNDGNEAFFEFISKTKFKKCIGCRRIIEKNGGATTSCVVAARKCATDVERRPTSAAVLVMKATMMTNQQRQYIEYECYLYRSPPHPKPKKTDLG